ncbi:HK97 family phage prohead protease [Mycolicibacterium sp.]|uniref:HK97 family phage prohead protease n=1 Tax=Mycolicibacterium sp. TaxID=2320850 RepID=UPI001A32E696|nr:HK97 family phage prohead protease [Mycolicibacterium sp.]MBJ7401598.1 HK97 family phage prohead protease [Mycolicibacterium sp.]
MHDKTISLTIKSADDETGTFVGYASVFDNVDAHGDVVRRGAFQKSISSGTPIPLQWEHGGTADPRNYVGDVIRATETDTGLEIVGKFDMTSDFGQAAYKNVKGRRVQGLSIGYTVAKQVKTAAGNELLDVNLVEVSVVSRGANAEATIASVKSAGTPTSPIRSRLARAAAERITTKTKAGNAMSTARHEMLTRTRETAVTNIKAILDNADAEGRDLSPDESAEVETHTKSIGSCDAGFAKLKSDDSIMAAARELQNTIGSPGSQPIEGGHLALTGKFAKAMAQKMVAAMPRDASNTKALAAGQQTTSTIVQPDVVVAGRPATSILDLLPMRVVSPSYSFIRQSARNLAFAPVAAGSEKPQSVVSVVAVENRLRVVASVTEQIDQYLVNDGQGNLLRFVEDEMLYGLRLALEEQILVGDGTGENFTGITETSGIQTQAFATDVLTSVRKGLTKLFTQNFEAQVVCLSAADWESIELLTATAGATDRAVPVDPVARRLWGAPVVLSQQLPADTALIIGDGAVTVDHDGVIDSRWSDAVGSDFKFNFLRNRTEGRFGLSVNQPAACVLVETAD